MLQITKKNILYVAIAMLVASFVGVGASGALAVITDSQIESVKSRCTELGSSLNQLERNDTLLRSNIGNSYLILSKQLMVPLNQRIAAGQLDGGSLVEIAAQYKKTYDDEFYVDFKEYEISLSETISISCQNEPSAFYDSIAESREKRKKLYASSQKIVSLAKQFKAEYVTFKKQTLKDSL